MKQILIALSILFFVSCGKKRETIQDNSQAIKVKVGGIAADDSLDFIAASGKVEAENSANIATRMMGYVTQVHVKVGQRVRTGQLLVSINSADLQAKKAQVDAGILQATAAFRNAQKDYDRFVALFAQQSASQKELDDMTSRYEMAKAALDGAKQQRNEVLAQFSYSNVTAPFSGEITQTFVKEGDMANPGMPLVSVEGNGRLQVTAMVSESDIAQIKNGMNAKVLVKSTQQELTGKVVEVSRSAKNTGGQYLVKINLNQVPSQVFSGMFVNVQFLVNKATPEVNVLSDKVLVPKSALVQQGQLTGIYTVSNADVAILRWLRIGKTFGGEVEVLSGLSADEQYIVSAAGKLYNGATVKIE